MAPRKTKQPVKASKPFKKGDRVRLATRIYGEHTYNSLGIVSMPDVYREEGEPRVCMVDFEGMGKRRFPERHLKLKPYASTFEASLMAYISRELRR